MADRYPDRPFPADNYRGGNQAPKGESDPLAELARLIGQTDPFAGIGGRANQPVQPRGNAREQFQQPPQPFQQPPPQRQQPQPPLQAVRPQPAMEPDDAPAGPPSWIQRAQQQPPQDLDTARPGPRLTPDPVDRPAPPFVPEQMDRSQIDRQQFDRQPVDRAAPPFAPEPLDRQPPQFAPEPDLRQAPSYVAGRQDPQSYVPSRQDPHQNEVDPQRYDEALYGQLPGGPRDLMQEAEFDEDPYAYQDDYGDGLADQDQRPQRRGLMFTVAVVLALAVIGTGGAFAYRAFFGTERSGDPPIIRADAGPNKMIPPQSGDSSGKLIQDRMTGGTERLVSREEQPVDPRDGRSGPRVILSSPSQGANASSAASAAPLNRPVSNSGSTSDDGNSGGSLASASSSGSANSGNGLLSGDEPRKIRTVSVKGDQTDAANPTPKPPVTRSIAAASSAPLRTPTPVAANANASTNAPLSISPQSADTPPPRSRVASTNPAPQPIVPAAATSAGSYMVQVSSQGSEADAQKSFKSLQGKYPDQLGSREATISQGDVHGRTVYRAMVGPFASSGEANQFCNGLKTAGGQCFVPRN